MVTVRKNNMTVYDKLVEALKDLKTRGFITEFHLAFNAIQCSKTGHALSPSEFEIVEHYRFEENTNPSDSSVIYAIQSKNGNMKGVLVNAYGTYSDAVDDVMIQKLSVHEA